MSENEDDFLVWKFFFRRINIFGIEHENLILDWKSLYVSGRWNFQKESFFFYYCQSEWDYLVCSLIQI